MIWIHHTMMLHIASLVNGRRSERMGESHFSFFSFIFIYLSLFCLLDQVGRWGMSGGIYKASNALFKIYTLLITSLPFILYLLLQKHFLIGFSYGHSPCVGGSLWGSQLKLFFFLIFYFNLIIILLITVPSDNLLNLSN